MTLARDGLREMLISTAVLGSGSGLSAWAAVTTSPWFWAIAAVLGALWLFTLGFFRDPHRVIPQETGLMVAPADGTVTEISYLDSYQGLDGPAIRIGIFLSIFSVHVNRAPCDGRVVSTEYRPGEFLDARHPESGSRNEANTIVIEPDGAGSGHVIVRQIAGVIARRVICHAEPNDSLKRGQRIGFIKFGSRTELIVRADCGLEPVIDVNDHVRAGSTVLMRVKQLTDCNVDPKGGVNSAVPARNPAPA